MDPEKMSPLRAGEPETSSDRIGETVRGGGRIVGGVADDPEFHDRFRPGE